MNHHFDLYNKHYSMLDSFISAILRQIDNTFNQSVCCGQFRNHFAETMWEKSLLAQADLPLVFPQNRIKASPMSTKRE